MATEDEVLELVAAFVRALQPELVIETGTHRGFGAKAIGEALKTNQHGQLISFEVDPALHHEAYGRTEDLPVVCLLRSSLDFTPHAPIDFAWFDSDTSLRVKEYQHYRPYMTDRTVVGFHDTNEAHGYRPQLEQLGLKWLDLPTPRGVTFGRVGSENLDG
jgi:predicted O-methyltransferase YrrM